MNIREKIYSLDFIKDANELNEILLKAKVDYVVWYGRVITHDDYEGCYPLNDFSNKVDKALPFRITSSTLKQENYEEAAEKIDALSPKERVYCINNLKLLHEACDNAYSAWKNKNIFIKIGIIISEFFRDFINPADHVVAFRSSLKALHTWDFCGAGFNSFSEEQVKKTFPNWEQLKDNGRIKKLSAYRIKDNNDQYLPFFRYYVETSLIENA